MNRAADERAIEKRVLRPVRVSALAATAIALAWLFGTASGETQPASAPIGAMTTCNPGTHPACPDYMSFYKVNAPWYPPKPGYKGLINVKQEYASTLDRNITVFWFKPEVLETDGDKLQSQALQVLDRLQISPGITTDLAVARAFWYQENTIRVVSYIFLRDVSGQWSRIHSAALVDQVIRAHL